MKELLFWPKLNSVMLSSLWSRIVYSFEVIFDPAVSLNSDVELRASALGFRIILVFEK